MTTPHTPPAALDVAAIEALSPEMQYDADEALGVYAQATTNGINRANARGLLRMRGVEYVGALLAHIAAERERHAAEVAAARAEALREAEDACRDVGDDYDPRCRERVGAHACAAAVAALGTKGGGA